MVRSYGMFPLRSYKVFPPGYVQTLLEKSMKKWMMDDERRDEDESQDVHGYADLGLHDDNGLDGQRHGGLQYIVVNQ